MKTVIAGLEEGLNAIADALEGGGGSSIVPTPAAADEGKVLTANDDGTASWETPEGGIPTPTLSDEGKVLMAVPQTQTKVAPEWATIRELPIGGRNGQVLTRSSEGYEWETPNELPALYDEDNGKVLIAQYDSDTENTYPAWGIIKQVPSGGATGQVLTRTTGSGCGWKNIVQVPSTSGASNGDVLTNDGGIPTWAPASGGGGSSSIKHIYQAFRGNTIFDDGNGNATITISSVPSGVNEDSFCPLGIVVRYISSGDSYPKYCNVIPVKTINIGNLLGSGIMITAVVDSANVNGHLTSSDYYDIGIVYYEKESM